MRTAVVESTFTSWREMAASAIGGDPPGPVSRFLAGVLIRDSHRPDEAVARIERPVLLIHGTGDSVIPIGHGRRLAAAAGPSLQFVEIEGGDHNSLHDTHPEVQTLVIRFFQEQLTADG